MAKATSSIRLQEDLMQVEESSKIDFIAEEKVMGYENGGILYMKIKCVAEFLELYRISNRLCRCVTDVIY